LTERPLTVAYVVDRWQVLSETFIREEVDALRARGVRVLVVALGPGDVVPEPSPDEHRVDLMASRGLVRTRAGLALLRRPRAAARFLAELRRMRPELPQHRRALPVVAEVLRRADVEWIHAHFGWEASGVAQALAPLIGCGWSFTAHANDIFVRNDHLRRKLAQVPHLVTVCQYNVDELQAVHGALPDHHVIVCGVRVPARAPSATPEVDVLAVGRLVPKKGFDLLIRAAAIVAPTRPSVTVEIIGDGPERAALQGLADQLGLSGQVVLRGALDHGEVLARLADARVVCLPARVAVDGDRDSMPVVLKEAMAAGVPVVGTSVVAIPEMVDDEVGRLVPPEDPPALAGALLELLADPSEAAARGAAGRQRVLDRFELDGEVAKLHRLFEAWARPAAPAASPVTGPGGG
jgi:colanic acid/amylovoran biosynthesis glycosyltransferase